MCVYVLPLRPRSVHHIRGFALCRRMLGIRTPEAATQPPGSWILVSQHGCIYPCCSHGKLNDCTKHGGGYTLSLSRPLPPPPLPHSNRCSMFELHVSPFLYCCPNSHTNTNDACPFFFPPSSCRLMLQFSRTFKRYNIDCVQTPMSQ